MTERSRSIDQRKAANASPDASPRANPGAMPGAMPNSIPAAPPPATLLHAIGLSGEIDVDLALRAARASCPILITGETGSGKGHLARWLHAHSANASGPFIPVNCGAIPDSLIDSQLFGHARGAFTGATEHHLGLVRAAEGGTLLLDEVSELPPSAQMRLLRLLQDCEVQPVGHSKPLIVNVRVIAATNIDLAEAVVQRRFRADLLFRLDVIRLAVRPLRERLSELPALLRRFNDEFAAVYRQPQLVFDSEALSTLDTYYWPGNVRQLRTLVERLHVLCPERQVDLPALLALGQLDPPPSVHGRLDALKRLRFEQLRRVLADSDGSITRTAKVFGVHRSTVYRWLQER